VGAHAVAAGAAPESGVFAGTGRWARGARGVLAAVVPLHGYAGAGVHRDEGTNALGAHAATPYLTGTQPAGDHVHVALHLLRLDEDTTAEALAAADPGDVVDVQVTGTTVRVRWADDGTEAAPDLADFVPWDGATTPGGPR
jgi:hypothetical protein